jgi:hypothetical protein
VAPACLDPVASWLPDPVAAHPAHRVHAALPATRHLDLAERFGITVLNAVDVTWRALPPAAGGHLADLAARARQRGIAVAVEAQVPSGIPNVAAAYELPCGRTGRAAAPDPRRPVGPEVFTAPVPAARADAVALRARDATERTLRGART